jgi:hypothetical protein
MVTWSVCQEIVVFGIAIDGPPMVNKYAGCARYGGTDRQLLAQTVLASLETARIWQCSADGFGS